MLTEQFFRILTTGGVLYFLLLWGKWELKVCRFWGWEERENSLIKSILFFTVVNTLYEYRRLVGLAKGYMWGCEDVKQLFRRLVGLGKGCIWDPEDVKQLACLLANSVSICFVAEVKGTIKPNFKIKAVLEPMAALDSCYSSAVAHFGFVRTVVLSCYARSAVENITEAVNDERLHCLHLLLFRQRSVISLVWRNSIQWIMMFKIKLKL